MIIDLLKLNEKKDKIDINETYSFTKEELKNTEIIKLDDIKIKGNIQKDGLDNKILNLKIKGIMVLPCSRTLKPTDYPFDIEINENLEEIAENFEKSQKTIDILPIIWENILMEIPIRVVSENTETIKTKGDGWELITEDEKVGNNSLAKLKDLL